MILDLVNYDFVTIYSTKLFIHLFMLESLWVYFGWVANSLSNRLTGHAHVPIRYGLVVRIPGSHPGGPGSIPGVGNPFWTPGIEYIFGNVKMVFFFLLGAARSRKNIASAGNRTRINCLEGSYADHYTTDAVLTLLLLSAKVPQPHSPAMCI